MNITTLQLADNCLSAEGARYLTQMLRANFTIQHLVSVFVCFLLRLYKTFKSIGHLLAGSLQQ